MGKVSLYWPHIGLDLLRAANCQGPGTRPRAERRERSQTRLSIGDVHRHRRAVGIVCGNPGQRVLDARRREGDSRPGLSVHGPELCGGSLECFVHVLRTHLAGASGWLVYDRRGSRAEHSRALITGVPTGARPAIARSVETARAARPCITPDVGSPDAIASHNGLVGTPRDAIRSAKSSSIRPSLAGRHDATATSRPPHAIESGRDFELQKALHELIDRRSRPQLVVIDHGGRRAASAKSSEHPRHHHRWQQHARIRCRYQDFEAGRP